MLIPKQLKLYLVIFKVLEGPGADEWVQLEAEEVAELLSNRNAQVSLHPTTHIPPARYCEQRLPLNHLGPSLGPSLQNNHPMMSLGL